MTLSSYFYTYTGGAHSYGSHSFYNIDLKDGKVLSDTILFGLNNLKEVGKLIQSEVEPRNNDENAEE